MDYKILLGAGIVLILFVFFRPSNIVPFENKLAQGESSPTSNDELTLYSSYGFFKEITNASLPLGLSSLSFDVPKTIDTSSIYLFDLSDPATSFLKNVFVPSLDNEAAIIQKSVHKNITIQTKNGTLTGELISLDSNLVLKTEKGTLIIPREEISRVESAFEPIAFSKVYATLINDNVGAHRLGISYLFSGVSWDANYVVTLADKLDLNSFIQVKNNAGRDFEDVALKFVAGDVGRVSSYPYPLPAFESKQGATAGENLITEQPLAEYHMYTLNETTTLKDGEETQLTLHAFKSIPFEKIFVFAPSESNKVKFSVLFQNKKESGVGAPLPAGTVRVYQSDGEGGLQFIGEDSISHTPENSNVTLSVGAAFDIVANRTRLEYKTTNCTSTTTYDVNIRNEKEEDIKVDVLERFYGDWNITSESQPHKSKTAEEVVWELSIPKKQSKALQYTILQRWCE